MLSCWTIDCHVWECMPRQSLVVGICFLFLTLPQKLQSSCIFESYLQGHMFNCILNHFILFELLYVSLWLNLRALPWLKKFHMYFAPLLICWKFADKRDVLQRNLAYTANYYPGWGYFWPLQGTRSNPLGMLKLFCVTSFMPRILTWCFIWLLSTIYNAGCWAQYMLSVFQFMRPWELLGSRIGGLLSSMVLLLQLPLHACFL